MNERGNSKLKFFDKYFGIPIVFGLGLLRKKKVKLLNPQEIVIVMIAAIGDTILLSSIIKELKQLYPSCNITLICSNGNFHAAKNIPHVVKIIKFEMSRVWNSFLSLRKQQKYDLLLDFGTWARLNALISFFINAEIKVGFKRKHMYRHYIYDQTVEHLDSLHELENYRNVLKMVNQNLFYLKPEFSVHLDSQLKIKEMLNSDQKYIIFHLFASGTHKEKKEWVELFWSELAERLIAENYNIVLTGGKEDCEKADAFVKLVNGSSGTKCFSFAGKASLEETAALIKEIGTIVTVNTGIMHLAATMNSNIVAIHGPTSPKRWGPVSDKSIILTPRIKCDNLLSLGFEKHNCIVEKGCISTITVEDVYKALKENYFIEKVENTSIDEISLIKNSG